MPKIKNIIIFTVIAIAFVLIYIYFIKQSPPEANLVSSGTSATLPNIDGSSNNEANTTNTDSLGTKDFLTLFSNIKNIKLDDAIFSDSAFNSLHDSSIVLIPDGTEGRPNPFAQFGNDAILPTITITTTTTPTTTIQPTTPAPSTPTKP